MTEITFPNIPLYQGWGKPLRTESTVEGLELVEGHVPEGLNGTWYRAGPDRQYPPMSGEDVFIDGEGMMHMFRFEDGHVSYKSRWSRNARFLAQEKAKRSLFGRYRNRYSDDPEAAGVHGGTANTNMIFHAGRMTVLKEDDLPYEVDPDTLATGPRTDFGGRVKATSLSAHPKLDLIRNELLTFSFQAKGDGSTDFAFYIFDEAGEVAHEMWFHAPWAGVVHDFAITETHVVVPFFPLVTTIDAVKEGKTFYEYHPDKPTHVAVFPRRGTTEDIRWFQGPNTTAGHMLNAVTEGSKVHLDLCLYTGNCFPFFRTPDGQETAAVPPILTRMTFDLERNDDGFETRVLTPRPGEMPRTDDRYQGRPYRWGYLIMARPADRNSAASSTIGRVDVTTGAVETWDHGQAISIHEPQFVPRSPDSPEGVGWLLVILNRLDQGHSELAVFDAEKVSAGPVARLHLPVRVRSTFHGSWVPVEALRTGRYNMQVAA